jgi:hypothetical protein
MGMQVLSAIVSPSANAAVAAGAAFPVKGIVENARPFVNCVFYDILLSFVKLFQCDFVIFASGRLCVVWWWQQHSSRRGALLLLLLLLLSAT